MIGRRTALKGMGAMAAGLAIGPALLAQTIASPRSWIPDDAMLGRLDALFQRHNVAGASFAILDQGEVAWTRSYGYRNARTGDPVTDTTLFQVASLSKPIFAYAVMNMVEHGRLRLEDRLADYFHPLGYSDTAWARAITVRHVLSHQTGLPNWRERVEGALLEPTFEPGTGYSYSGEAFCWLQEVVEAIEGASLQEVATKYLFAPAGLDISYLWLPERDEREVYGHSPDAAGRNVPDPLQFNRAYGPLAHALANRWGRSLSSLRQVDMRELNKLIDWPADSPLAERPEWHWQRPFTALANAPSSARSSAADYARFLALMMPGPKAHGLLGDESRRLMLTPQTERADRPHMPAGLGWGIERFEGRNYYQHWGLNGSTYMALALADPETGRGIVAMANSKTGGNFIDEAAALLTRTPFRTFVG